MRHVKGITLIGFMFFAVCICALGLLVMRVTPVYLEYYQVRHALSSLDAVPKNKLKQPPMFVVEMLRKKIINQLYVGGVESISKKDIKITRKPRSYLIIVPYEVKRKLVSNISLLFEFSPKKEVSLVE